MDLSESETMCEELILQMQGLQSKNCNEELTLFIKNLCNELQSVDDGRAKPHYTVVHEIIRILFNATKCYNLLVAEASLEYLVIGFKIGWLEEATLLKGDQRTIYLRAVVCVTSSHFEKDANCDISCFLNNLLNFLISICQTKVLEDFVACEEDLVEVLSSLLNITSSCICTMTDLKDSVPISYSLLKRGDLLTRISRNAAKLALSLIRYHGFVPDMLNDLDEQLESIINYFVSWNDTPLRLILGEILHAALRCKNSIHKELQFQTSLKSQLNNLSTKMEEMEQYSENMMLLCLSELTREGHAGFGQCQNANVKITLTKVNSSKYLVKNYVPVFVSLGPFGLEMLHCSPQKTSYLGLPFHCLKRAESVDDMKLSVLVDLVSHDAHNNWTGIFHEKLDAKSKFHLATADILFSTDTDMQRVQFALSIALTNCAENKPGKEDVNSSTPKHNENAEIICRNCMPAKNSSSLNIDDFKKVSFATTKEIFEKNDQCSVERFHESSNSNSFAHAGLKASLATTKNLIVFEEEIKLQSQSDISKIERQSSQIPCDKIEELRVYTHIHSQQNRSSIATTKEVSATLEDANDNNLHETSDAVSNHLKSVDKKCQLHATPHSFVTKSTLNTCTNFQVVPFKEVEGKVGKFSNCHKFNLADGEPVCGHVTANKKFCTTQNEPVILVGEHNQESSQQLCSDDFLSNHKLLFQSSSNNLAGSDPLGNQNIADNFILSLSRSKKRMHTNTSDAGSGSPQPQKRLYASARASYEIKLEKEKCHLNRREYSPSIKQLIFQENHPSFQEVNKNDKSRDLTGNIDFTCAAEDCLHQAIKLLRARRNSKKKKVEEIFFNEIHNIKRKGKEVTEKQIRRADTLFTDFCMEMNRALDCIETESVVPSFARELQTLINDINFSDKSFINLKYEHSVKDYKESQFLIKKTINSEILKFIKGEY